jgi:hypothetical protein
MQEFIKISTLIKSFQKLFLNYLDLSDKNQQQLIL